MAIQLLPTWMLRRHLLIWKQKKDTPITFKECKELLRDDAKVIAVFLSNLNRMGWIDVKKDSKDARRRLYIFHNPKIKIEKCLEVIK